MTLDGLIIVSHIKPGRTLYMPTVFWATERIFCALDIAMKTRQSYQIFIWRDNEEKGDGIVSFRKITVSVHFILLNPYFLFIVVLILSKAFLSLFTASSG